MNGALAVAGLSLRETLRGRAGHFFLALGAAFPLLLFLDDPKNGADCLLRIMDTALALILFFTGVAAIVIPVFSIPDDFNAPLPPAVLRAFDGKKR